MIHVIVAVFAVFGTLWALAIWIVGGFTIAPAGRHDSVARSASAAGGRRDRRRSSMSSTRGPLNLAPPHDAARRSARALPRDRRHRAQLVDGRRRRPIRVRVAGRSLAAARPDRSGSARRDGALARSGVDVHAARVSTRGVGRRARAGDGSRPSAADGRRKGDRGPLRDVSRHAAERCAARVDHLRDRTAARI